MPRTLFLAAVTAMSLPLSAGASGLDGFSSFYAFGDSTTDPGNAAAAVFGRPISPIPGVYPNGWFSDGAPWAVRLGADFASGRNYAFGGATAVTSPAVDLTLPGAQVTLDIPDLPDQVDSFVSGVATGAIDPGPNGLAGLWVGGNDLRNAETPGELAAAVRGAVTSITRNVGRLLDAGLSEVVVFNLPDLGLLPEIDTAFDRAVATIATVAFNDRLRSALTNSFGPEVGVFDTFGLFRDVVDDPSAFGFANTDDACLPRLIIGVVPDCDRFLFYDDVHPTGAAHALVADRFSEQVGRSLPAAIPLPAGGLLLLGGLGGLLVLRRTRKPAC